jgi:adenine deaminase
MRKAVALGCPPAQAVLMGTLNAARYHRLDGKGALAPGFIADVVGVPDLVSFQPVSVWRRGRLVVADGETLAFSAAEAPSWMRGSIRLGPVTADDFAVAANGRIRVIGVVAGQLTTASLAVDATTIDGFAVADPARDLAKVAVLERHRRTGRIGLGFVTGFGLRRGALASSHAHDAHNVIVVGVDDQDMATAVRRLTEIGGGQVAAAGGRVLAEVPCPIGGLLSDRPVEEVAAAVRGMHEVSAALGCTGPAPYMAMSFLALSVIPALRITDRGLVDTDAFEIVSLSI